VLLPFLAVTSVSVDAGLYRLADRSESAYDGPQVELRHHVGMGGPWSFVSELGLAGEFAGGHGSCLGEASSRLGASWAVTPGPSWLRLQVGAGGGLVYARLYGSLFGEGTGANAALNAYGDRWLPQAWLTVSVAASLTHALSLVLTTEASALPSAWFQADHLPTGMRSDFYPAFRRDHDLSTYGATFGLAYAY
jgi:hypothetical protein